jgi:SAM-dependent methyltransferase
VTPNAYEAWYDSPRGRWIAAEEYELLRALLAPAPGASLVDVGCGTGHFTRRFAGDLRVVGLDPNREWLAYARARTAAGERYVAGRAEALPFPDTSFDYAVSVTALCFVADQARALRELLRVTRRRFALGLLNRNSLLYLQTGRAGGSGGYRGAHWHTASEVRALFAPLAVANLRLRTAVLVPGGAWAGALERCAPRSALFGGFLAVAADVEPR